MVRSILLRTSTGRLVHRFIITHIRNLFTIFYMHTVLVIFYHWFLLFSLADLVLTRNSNAVS